MRFVGSRLGRSLLAAVTAGALASTATGQVWQPAIDVVVRRGDPAPGLEPGTTFGTIWWPFALNDAGEVAFLGWVDTPEPPTGSEHQVIWASDGQGGLTAVARGDDPAPGYPGSTYTFFSYFSPPIAWLTNAGEPAFDALLSTPAGIASDLFGPFGSPTPAPFVAALIGQPAPGAEPAVFATAPPFHVNVLGQAGFAGTLETGSAGVDDTNDEGIWGPDAGSDLALLAREGSAAPGLPAGSLFDGFGGPVVGDAGGLAFIATLVDGTGDVTAGNRTGTWLRDGGGALALVARTGWVAPGTAGSLFDAFTGGLAVNDVGQAAFSAHLRLGTGDVTAENDKTIWLADSVGGLTLVMRAGTEAPGTAPGSLFDRAEIGFALRPERLDDLGRVLFHALLTVGTGDVTADNAQGFWLFEPGPGLSLIARAGDPIPDMPGVVFESFDGTRGFLSGNGDLGFYADFEGASQGTGFFQRALTGEIVTVFATGQSIEVAAGVQETIVSIPAEYDQDLTDMNAHGESAHLVRTDGRGDTGIVVSLPEPAGVPVWLAAAGLLRLLDRRRRRT